MALLTLVTATFTSSNDHDEDEFLVQVLPMLETQPNSNAEDCVSRKSFLMVEQSLSLFHVFSGNNMQKTTAVKLFDTYFMLAFAAPPLLLQRHSTSCQSLMSRLMASM